MKKKGAIPIQGSDLYAVQYQRSYSTDVFITETILFIVPGKDADLDKCIIPNTDSTNSVWANSGAIGLYIADGVTEIGNHAFDGMSTLETVEFQDSTKLTKVGEYAFNNCDKMVGLSLDLSNVTTLGKYAFNGCERLGSGENNKGVTLNDALTTIPENAFNTCGLKNVNIPKSCTKIEKNAFAHNSLSEVGELVLPDGLVTIGDSAFVVTMGSGETGIGITSLTIPSSVKSIGANAFSGRRNLAEVTVEDDNNPGTTLTLGDHAFGYNESSAFSEWGSITDAANITYTGNLGTEFHLPADIAQSGVFENGKTCYTGDISPMTYDTTLEPTCTTAGYHQYKTTISGAITENGEPVEVQYRVPLGALGHKWGEIKEVGASCERDGYFYQDCVRTDCEARTSTIEGSTGLFDTETGSALTPEEMEDYTPDEAEGHTYRPDRIEAPILAASQKTVLHYVCKNPKHDDERDSTTKDYPFTLQGKTLFATTTDTLNDLTSQLTGFSSSGIVSWDVEGNQLSQEFGEEGTKYVNVKFTPKNAGVFTDNVFSKDSSGTHLQITIQVKKAVVDLSGFSFSQNAVSMDQLESATVTASGFGGDAKQDGKIEFYNPAGGTWASEMPTEIGGDYKVRVPFSYETSKFRLPTDSEDEYPQDGSKIVTENGKNYLVHDFAIIIQSINATVRAKQNLVYDGTEKTTVSVSSLRENCHVAFYLWENDDWVQKGTYTSTKAGDSTEGISLKNAGTYKVKVEITLDQFETQTEELEVTIAKAPVQKPVAKENLQYLPKETQQGFESLGGEDELYIITGGTGVDAKTYTATATLNDSANYCWQGENASTATVQIPWTILPQRLTKPNANSARDYSYQYGQYREPLTTTAGNNYDVDRNEETGLKGVYYIGNQENEGYEKEYAYTVTNSWMTDAKEYTSVVHLNDNKNYVWHDGSSDDVTIHWEIRKATLELPNVTVKTEAKNVPYDGEAYEEANIIVAEKTLPGDVVPGAYEYARNEQFSGATENAPTDAGDYFVRRSYTYNADNYAVVGSIPFASFTITPAEATMTFTEGEETATYTAQGTPLQQVKVTNLVTVDVGKPASDVYTVTYTYKYRNDNTDWEEVKTETTIEEPNSFKFTDVGEYQITATFSSNNYTAADATYTLTIKKANAQKITLTSAGTNKGQWNEENKTYTTTYGAEASFTITGTAALDEPVISYKVKDDSEKGPDGNTADVLDVNGSSGVVTINQAGTATITVTAAETPNVGAASVEYTVTVEKAKPALELDAGTAAYTGSAVADNTYKKATLSGAGDGYAQPDKDELEYYFYTYDEDGQDTILADTENGNALQKAPSSVGDYWLKVVFPGDACYSDAVTAAKFTITPAELSVSATGHTGTYDGETHSAIAIDSVKGNGEEITDYTVKYATTGTSTPPEAGDDVWEGTLSVKDVEDSTSESLYYWYMVQDTAGNYEPKIEQVKVSITPAELTLKDVPNSYTKTYDGDNDVETDLTGITVTGIATESISVTATGTYDNENAGEGKNVTLTLTLSGTNIDWGNYSYNGTALTEGEITLTQADAGTITPKEITVTGISAVDRVYDGTKVVQLTGEPKTEDTLFNEDETVFLALAEGAKGQLQDATAGNGKAVSVGNDAVEITGKGSDNYSVTVSLPNLTVDIEKATPTVTITGASENKLTVAYTGNPVNIAATVAGISDTDKPTGEVTFRSYKSVEAAQNDTTGTGGTELEEMPSNGGPYYLRAFIAEDTNYKAAVSDYVELVIDATALSVTTGEPAEKPYTGKEHNMAQWADMKVQFSGKDVQYDVVFLKKGEDETSAPDAEDEKWNSGVSAITNVAESGEYWYKVTAKEGEGNFEPHVSTSAITFTVTPATLTLSSSLTKEKEYDGTTAAVVTEQKVTGAQSGENITVSSVSAAYNDANEGTDKTITTTYKVTFDVGVTPGNYTIGNSGAQTTHNDDGTWTVTTKDTGSISAKSITVTIADKNKIYDGKTPSVTSDKGTDWTVDAGALCSQNGTVDELRVVLSVESDGNSAVVGTYAITGKAENKNYAVTFTGNWQGEEGDQNNNKAGTYTIDPRPINVQIGNAEGFYGDAPVLTGVTLTYESTVDNRGLAPDEENVPGIELGTGANKESPVAEYTIYAVNGDNRVELIKPVVIGNYNVTFTQNGTYTVKQRPITITIEDQESDYGCEIAKLAYSETLSNTYTGSNKNVVFVGDDEDELGITLSTTAKKGSDAGTYPISGEAKAESSVVSNYAITWKGETPFTGEGEPDSTKATYTVEKADLDVEFTNETVNISMGGQVENPLKYINASNENENLSEKPDGVTVTYSSSDPSVAEVNSSTGEVTLAGVGDATITANVTDGGKNFNSGASATYELHVAQDGGLRTTVTPVAGLTYTGKMQDLVTYTTSPEGATVTFTVTAQESGDQYKIGEDGIPQALDAGTYTVSWRTTLEGYREETGSITVTVAKADPSKGFTPDSVSVAYEENKIYDSTEDTILQVEVGYASEAGNSITYLSDDTQVARVEDNNLETILLNSMGTAHISARFAETENFQEQTVFFTLTVGQATTMINYTAEDYKVTYDGQAHGSRITVTSPSEYTIKYSDNQGASYDLDESPAITDAGSRTIYFQIQADGYQSAIGTQTVTVEPKPIKEEMIAGIAESYTYTGKGITFDDAISVHDEGVLLKQNTDYTVSYDQNTAVGTNTGSVTITGKGNYKESVTKNFTISPVDASDLTASLDRTFGYYGDSNTNNATVTVTHGGHTVTSDASNTVSVAVTQFNGAAANNEATVSGQTVTFNQVGTYTIEVTVTGNHATNAPIQLTYALLPVEEGELVLEADNETSIVATYGEPVNGDITVTDANGTSMTENIDYSLTYTYTPFEGTAQGSKPYDPSVMSGTPAAGMYVVTATGQGGYANSVGTFTFLILQRDLAKATLAVNDTDLVFNHDEKRPSVTVTVDGNAQPTKDTDYTVTYYNNVNASKEAKAVVTATGNNFTGSQTAEFTIAPKEITADMVQDIPEQYYTGNAVIPPVTIKDGDYTLILGYDYTTACDAIGPGTATVTIEGKGNYTSEVEKTFTITSGGAPAPTNQFDLTVTPNQWTWEDDLTGLDLSVTFGEGTTLTLGTNYTLNVKGGEVDQNFTGGADEGSPVDFIKSLKPGTYTITATGTNAYKDSKDTETVTVKKIQPELTVTAAPETLSGGGKVTLTLKGEKLPAFAEGQDLSSLLTASAKDEKNAPDLSELEWETDEQTGVMTAELTLPNTSETYTFTLTFTGNEYYEAATASEQVVVAQQIISGGGGGPVEDQPADPDDTGVSDWLNTKDHLAYLAGYPGGTFGPDQNMTRAEAAQMFYNLLLEKDVEITVEFVDVPEDAWYATPVNTLASLGILSGVGNGRFDPERSITRAEFTVIAMKFANTSGGGVNIFSDVNEDDWFYSAVVDSTQYGWINGYPDGTFRPEATISRAEVTVIVNHMLGRAADRPYVIAHEKELNTFGDVNRGHWGYFHIAEATNAHEYHTEDGTESWTGLS